MIELPPAEPEPEKPADEKPRRAGPATQWRKTDKPPASRGLLLGVATLLFCGVTGVALGILGYLGAPKPPYFVTLPVEGYGRNYPAATAAEADGEWLMKVFEPDRRENAKNFGHLAEKFRDRLAVMREGRLLPVSVGATGWPLEVDRPLVTHVACHVAVREGKVHVLPGDAAPDGSGWVPLDELLDAIAACPARDKCLLLDVGRPRTRTFAGPYADDALAPLHAHLKARRDGGTLPFAVIVSCGEGQSSHVMGVTGVSAFAYYVAEGLRGAADPANPTSARDDCVTLRELDAFLKLRVARWVKRNRDAAQSPVLYAADGLDFKLTYRKHPTPPATTEEADDPLNDAIDPYRESAGQWAKVTPPAVAASAEWPGRTVFAVPLPATATAAAGAPPTPDAGAAVVSAFDTLWRATSAAKVDDAKVKEAEGKFGEAAKALPPEVVSRVLWAWLLDTHAAPKTRLLQLLRETLAPPPLRKLPEFREFATLDFVLSNDIAAFTEQGEALAGRLFAVEREFAELLKLGDAEFDWVQSRAVGLVATQRAIKARLAARQAVPPGELENLRVAALDTALALRTAQQARASLDSAASRLAGTARGVAEFGRPDEKQWVACAEAATRLADEIDRAPSANWRSGDWARLTAALDQAVQPLVTPTEAAAVKALVEAAPKAGPAELRTLEATRANPFLAAKDREAVTAAINQVARRLHLATRKDDLAENESGRLLSPERVPAATAHDPARARLEVSARLQKLAGLGPVPPSAVASAWAKGRKSLAAELLAKNDVPRLVRLARVAPFGLDSPDDFTGAIRQARVADLDRQREAYRLWRVSCSR